VNETFIAVLIALTRMNTKIVDFRLQMRNEERKLLREQEFKNYENHYF
jgi:hypothetical protein